MPPQPQKLGLVPLQQPGAMNNRYQQSNQQSPPFEEESKKPVLSTSASGAKKSVGRYRD